jgi:hypothetical protein
LPLTAFEFFSEKALKHVMAEKGLQRPFESATNFYALVEFENQSESDLDTAMEVFEHCLESGWVIRRNSQSKSNAGKKSVAPARRHLRNNLAVYAL